MRAEASAGPTIGFPILFLLLAPIWTAPPLDAQAAAAPPLPPHHWAYDLLEALDAGGFTNAWMYDVRPVSREVVRNALQRAAEADFIGADIVESWRLRFDSLYSLMIPGRPGGGRALEPQLALGADHLKDPFLDGGGRLYSESGRTVYGKFGLVGRLEEAEFSAWFEFDTRIGGSLGLAFPVGSSSVMISGQKLKAAGPGRTSTQMTGHLPMDALVFVGNERFDAPSSLGRSLGPIAWHAGIGTWDRVSGPTLPNTGLFLTAGAVAQPREELRIGVTRTARLGHPDGGGLGFGGLLRTTLFLPDDEDDQKLELSLRYRWTVAERSFATYVILAHEEGAPWKEPGLIAGGTIPFVREEGLYALRYEYVAFGPRAGGSSRYGADPASSGWYRQEGFGDGTYERESPVGSPLGGYGASHTAELLFWSGDGWLRGKAWAFFEVREAGNLLEDRWPGKRRGGGLEIALHDSRALELGVAALLSHGQDFGFEWGASLQLSWNGGEGLRVR